MSHTLASSELTVLLSGMIAGVPKQGGATWAVLNYLLGLKRLGHDVFFVEPLDRAALRPLGASLETSANAGYFRQVMRGFGLESCSTLLEVSSRETAGLPVTKLDRIARQADVLINIAGMLPLDEPFDRIPVRLYLDLDPAFTQLWQHAQRIDMRFAGHTHFVTVGLSIGQADCPVPTCGLKWLTTLQPIALAYWPVSHKLTCEAFTTVANWRGYGSIEYCGVFYGQKAHSFREFIDLPRLTTEKFVTALSIHPDERKDVTALRDAGWLLADPQSVASSPDSYQRFIQGSKGELGIAKRGYVAAPTGWFSDRSVCYLASGRPVIAQETGFSRFLPTGEGLMAFSTTEGALASIDTVNADYARHARAARAIAEEHFASDKVLSRLLRLVGAS